MKHLAQLFVAVWKAFFPPKRRRLELRLVTRREASTLLLEGWSVAPEEELNRREGVVWLERLEPVPEFKRS